KNKGKLILSSIVILLPMVFGLLFRDQLPDRFATHWGAGGRPDGWSGPDFFLFMPLLLLALHWMGIILTLKDPRNADQHPKAFRLVIWLVPALSLMMMGFVYFVALGNAFSALRLMQLVFGLMFTVLGNYMPKIRRNSTLGIKISWTLDSEENWNATHRFAGKVWAACGAAMLLGIFLPEGWSVPLLLLAILPATILPILYSWRFRKKQLEEGTLSEAPMTPQRKKSRTASLILTAALLIFVAVMMFSGSIRANAADTALEIKGSFGYSLTLPYEKIDSMELREEPVSGTRVNGVGSARLLLGTFQNEEFGTYTRYTYTGSDCAIVIGSEGKTLVLALESSGDTRALYEALLERTK
ncbi:MAG: SdpI family protein, partial [Clostridia bacterium]|nr:SdpI family protein [Clostridia bacterium]